MLDRTARLDVELRPHVKTHKSTEIARIQLEGRPEKITVSTLAEARGFAAAGFRDLTWAIPLPEGRIDEALSLSTEVERLDLLVDHVATVDALEDAASRRGLHARALVKVDCGYHRAGVDPNSDDAVALVTRVADARGLDLVGILTHAGHAYAARDRTEILAVAKEERDRMVAFAERLRAHGIDAPRVSIGSTPTLAVAGELDGGLDGIDEVRPGNYALFDGFQTAIGACAPGNVALSILATVIGTYPERGTVILDAGGTALSYDPGAIHVDARFGYGRVVSADGATLGAPDATSRLPGLRVTSLSQEHGVIRDVAPEVARALPVGRRVRVLPNHACIAANLHGTYTVVRDGAIVDRWSPIRGW